MQTKMAEDIFETMYETFGNNEFDEDGLNALIHIISNKYKIETREARNNIMKKIGKTRTGDKYFVIKIKRKNMRHKKIINV
jgi:hypothetical protein